MKILVGNFNEKLRIENILKPTLGMRVYIKIPMILVLKE
jgi:hypothetical protein